MSKTPRVRRTARVSPIPLRSPKVTGPAPFLRRAASKAASTAGCVEPGVGSLLL